MPAQWTPEIDAVLGQKTDAEVAKLAGCTIQAVYQRRRKMGIPAANPKHNEPGVTPAEVRALMDQVRTLVEFDPRPGVISYTALGRACEVNETTVRRWVSGRRTPDRKSMALIRAWVTRHSTEIK